MKDNGTKGAAVTDSLTIMFVVLKLTHVIDWSWWLVLSPTWISLLLVLIITIIVFLKEASE